MVTKQERIVELFKDLRFPLMGIATIMVMLIHTNYAVIQTVFKTPFLISVDIFLYLSGYGLIISFKEKQPALASFYKKRLLRVIPTLWFIVIIVFSIINLLPHSISKHFLAQYTTDILIRQLLAFNFFATGNTFLWYVDAILLLYILFPLYAKKFLKSNRKGFITIAGILITLAASVLVGQFSKNGNIQLFVIRIPAFLIGIYAGSKLTESIATKENTESRLPGFLKITTLLGMTIAGLVLYAILFTIASELKLNAYDKTRYGILFYSHVFLVHPVILIMLKILDFFSNRKLFRFIPGAFSFIGKISLQVYIVHMFILLGVLLLVNSVPFAKKYANTMWTAGIILSVFISYLTLKLMNLFVDKVTGKRNVQVLKFNAKAEMVKADTI